MLIFNATALHTTRFASWRKGRPKKTLFHCLHKDQNESHNAFPQLTLDKPSTSFMTFSLDFSSNCITHVWWTSIMKNPHVQVAPSHWTVHDPALPLMIIITTFPSRLQKRRLWPKSRPIQNRKKSRWQNNYFIGNLINVRKHVLYAIHCTPIHPAGQIKTKFWKYTFKCICADTVECATNKKHNVNS